MAKQKRELVWIETAGFKGWGCNLCSWKSQIPKVAATSKSPSAETRSDFYITDAPPRMQMSVGIMKSKNGSVQSVAARPTTRQKKMR